MNFFPLPLLCYISSCACTKCAQLSTAKGAPYTENTAATMCLIRINAFTNVIFFFFFTSPCRTLHHARLQASLAHLWPELFVIPP